MSEVPLYAGEARLFTQPASAPARKTTKLFSKFGFGEYSIRVQGCLAHKEPPARMTLPFAYASGPMVVLGGRWFLMSEITLSCIVLYCSRPLRRPRSSSA